MQPATCRSTSCYFKAPLPTNDETTSTPSLLALSELTDVWPCLLGTVCSYHLNLLCCTHSNELFGSTCQQDTVTAVTSMLHTQLTNTTSDRPRAIGPARKPECDSTPFLAQHHRGCTPQACTHTTVPKRQDSTSRAKSRHAPTSTATHQRTTTRSRGATQGLV